MRRKFLSFAQLGAAVVAIGMTWSAPAVAITSFSITPNPTSGSPGSTIDLVFSVTDAENFGAWANVFVSLDSVTGFQGTPLPGAPEFPYVNVDPSPGSVVTKSLIGAPGPLFEATGQLAEVCNAGVVGCFFVADFNGLTSANGELLAFKLKIGANTPVSTDNVVVTYSVSYALKDGTLLSVPGVGLALPEINVMVVPEPSTYGLFGAGLVMVLFAGRRRFQRAAPKVS